jgi:hypothetical protein
MRSRAAYGKNARSPDDVRVRGGAVLACWLDDTVDGECGDFLGDTGG